MRITLESTAKLVTLNGVRARIWEGQTESGIRIYAFVTRIAVAQEEQQEEFQRELEEYRARRPRRSDVRP